ncbi:MAG: hypothetical protein QOJ35_2967 [Solirubrobacteraceae bacterium]|jgi:hypothetical protein|nr:hypothetical protein [Solirubrobacteraceae bacterium]
MARLICVEDLVGPPVLGRGGHAMHVLQILESLRGLGHDVLFLEYLDEPPSPAALASFEQIVARWWDPARAALLDARTGACHAGVPSPDVAAFAARADALLSLAAHYRSEPWPLLEEVRPRLLFEQDPGYTHVWADGGDPAAIFGRHDMHFTVGANVGTPRSRVPACDLRWHPLWPPVVLDWWARSGDPLRHCFTTVAAWRDYGYFEFEGRLLGPKVDEFERFIELPALAGQPLELALAIDADDPDRERLLAFGWHLEDPAVVSTPERYRDYVCASLGEFSCAKGGYVGTRGGWFSDRSACYLAAGRPVVLQATGFEDLLPTGRGLFAVHTVEEATAALVEIRGDYARHAAAARELAREHFDGRRLLGDALELAGLPRRGAR